MIKVRNKTMNEMPAIFRMGQVAMAAFSTNKAAIGVLALLLGSGLAATSALAADNRAPEVPDEIAVGITNKVYFHGFALGVQIYTWNGASWGNAVPRATLARLARDPPNSSERRLISGDRNELAK